MNLFCLWYDKWAEQTVFKYFVEFKITVKPVYVLLFSN